MPGAACRYFLLAPLVVLRLGARKANLPMSDFYYARNLVDMHWEYG